MQVIDEVYTAYSSRDNQTLFEALERLQLFLFTMSHKCGPGVAALQLHQNRPHLVAVLNKISAQTENSLEGKLAFQAGYMAAVLTYFEEIVNQEEVDSAEAQMFCGDNQTSSIRIMILKSAFTHVGTRFSELVNSVARVAKVGRSLVIFHLRKLTEMKLLERKEYNQKIVAYRITHIGEAVLSRRLNPHELALYMIDLAEHDEAMRAAIENEISYVWLKHKSK